MTKQEAEEAGYVGYQTGRKNSGSSARKKKPIQVSFDDGTTQVFDCIQDASNHFGIHVNTIGRRLKIGGSPTSGPGKGLEFHLL